MATAENAIPGQGDQFDLLAQDDEPAGEGSRTPVEWRCPACHTVERNESDLRQNHWAEIADDGTITRGTAMIWDEGMCVAMSLTRNHVANGIWKLERSREVDWCRTKAEAHQRLEDGATLKRDIARAHEVWGDFRFWPGMLDDTDRLITGLDILREHAPFALEMLLMPDWDHRLIERYKERSTSAGYVYRLSRKRGFVWRWWTAPKGVPELAISWEEIAAATAGETVLPWIREWAEATPQRTDWGRPYQLKLPAPTQDQIDADWARPGHEDRMKAWSWTNQVYEAAIKKVGIRDDPPF